MQDRAVFEGAPQLGRLSARLAVGEEVDDQDVATALGPDVLDAFRFAQARMAGKVRKTTGEPSFCHSADLALRAADLGYGQAVRVVGLLHDVVEDTSGGVQQALRLLDVVEARFGGQVAADLRVVSNRYAMLLEEACALLPAGVPLVPESVPRVQEAVGRLYESLPPEVRQTYAREFHRLYWFLHGVDLTRGAQKARLDHGYTLKKELALLAYRPFVEELADDARSRAWPLYEGALVVKGLDLVDNLRTTEVAAFAAVERMLVKAETWLDHTFYLHDLVRQRDPAGTSFLDFYDYVKLQLVEQLAERSRALAFLSDGRFAILVGFLMDAIARVQDKYRVGPDLVVELRRLRRDLRRRHGLEG
ncbi:HD domain-containing protein [Myxococcota bacterium]|nr:HD domain-containing protein [Myxococcota bacterium]